MHSASFAPVANRFRSRGLAASAAAIGYVALISTARAQIVFSGLLNETASSDFTFNLDFNSDSQADLTLAGYISGGKGDELLISNTDVSGETGQWLVNNGFPAQLSSGQPIAGTFSTGSHTADFYDNNGPTYNWAYGNTGYLGIDFTSGGNTYLGWVQFSIASNGDSVTLVDWAYNSTPGGAIDAGQTSSATPEPASASAIAGAAALLGAMWWKRRSFRRWSGVSPCLSP